LTISLRGRKTNPPVFDYLETRGTLPKSRESEKGKKERIKACVGKTLCAAGNDAEMRVKRIGGYPIKESWGVKGK